jgi:hypothetical protein
MWGLYRFVLRHRLLSGIILETLEGIDEVSWLGIGTFVIDMWLLCRLPHTALNNDPPPHPYPELRFSHSEQTGFS